MAWEPNLQLLQIQFIVHFISIAATSAVVSMPLPKLDSAFVTTEAHRHVQVSWSLHRTISHLISRLIDSLHACMLQRFSARGTPDKLLWIPPCQTIACSHFSSKTLGVKPTIDTSLKETRTRGSSLLMEEGISHLSWGVNFLPKAMVGLGIRTTCDTNNPLIAKLSWLVHKLPDGIWAQDLKGKYTGNQPLLQAPTVQSRSCVWKVIKDKQICTTMCFALQGRNIISGISHRCLKHSNWNPAAEWYAVCHKI